MSKKSLDPVPDPGELPGRAPFVEAVRAQEVGAELAVVKDDLELAASGALVADDLPTAADLVTFVEEQMRRSRKPQNQRESAPQQP